MKSNSPLGDRSDNTSVLRYMVAPPEELCRRKIQEDHEEKEQFTTPYGVTWTGRYPRRRDNILAFLRMEIMV